MRATLPLRFAAVLPHSTLTWLVGTPYSVWQWSSAATRVVGTSEKDTVTDTVVPAAVAVEDTAAGARYGCGWPYCTERTELARRRPTS
jgi:hypothetical protein